MADQKNITTTKNFLERGVAEVIVKKEFLQLLEDKNKAPLRLKMGFDPSAPDLHLGHAVGLRKLRQLQNMGHKVSVIVGEWTAQMFVMSQLGREDIFPVKDAGIRSAMGKLYSLDEVTDENLIELSSNWSPQRSLACKYLWKALDLGYFTTK